MVALSQAFDIHFLGLFFQSSLVFDYSQDNLAVKEDAGTNRNTVVEDVSIKDKADGVPVL